MYLMPTVHLKMVKTVNFNVYFTTIENKSKRKLKVDREIKLVTHFLNMRMFFVL